MGIADSVIWLFMVLIVVGTACLAWWIVRPKQVVVRAPQPAPPVRPAAAVSAPGYLPRWDGTRRWSVREEKNAWDSAFRSTGERARRAGGLQE